MKYLKLAFSFLTILPASTRDPLLPGDLGRAAGWFPLVGLAIGGLVALGKLALGLVFPPLLASGLAVALWVFLTGALHLDGLADCCDGLLNPASPERRLEIMRDPRLGTFGGAGLALYLLLKVFAVLSLPPEIAWVAILLAAANARWLVLLAGRQPMARPGGLGADFALGLDRKGLLRGAVIPLILMIAAGWPGVLAVVLAHLAALGVVGVARKRLGGMTGDVIGLTVELGELAALLAFSMRLPALG